MPWWYSNPLPSVNCKNGATHIGAQTSAESGTYNLRLLSFAVGKDWNSICQRGSVHNGGNPAFGFASSWTSLVKKHNIILNMIIIRKYSTRIVVSKYSIISFPQTFHRTVPMVLRRLNPMSLTRPPPLASPTFPRLKGEKKCWDCKRLLFGRKRNLSELDVRAADEDMCHQFLSSGTQNKTQVR